MMIEKKSLIFYFLVIFILFSACNNGDKPGDQKNSRERPAGKVNISPPGLSDDTDYAAMESVALPKNFPPDIYLYANARNIKSLAIGQGFTVTLFTSDAPEKVVADYREQARLSQWKDEKVLELTTQAILKYKVGNYTVAVQVAQKRDGSFITLSVR